MSGGKHSKANVSRRLQSGSYSGLHSRKYAHRGGSIGNLSSARASTTSAYYNHRVKSVQEYAKQTHAKSRRRRRLVIAGFAVFILLIAVAVGIFAFFKSSDAKLNLDASNAKEALQEVSDSTGTDDTSTAPYYILLACLEGTSYNPYDADEMTYMLVRVDENAKELTFISIPGNLEVRSTDDEWVLLKDTQEIGGDAETINALNSALDVEINHFAYTTVENLGDLVDYVGGLTINISEEIDDPNAGVQVLYAGEQTLSGTQAKTYLRAENFSNGFEGVTTNRVSFMLALAKTALAGNSVSFATLVGDLGDYISTDFDTAAIMSLSDIFANIDEAQVYISVLPSYETEDASTKVTSYDIDSSAWEAMFALIDAGYDPNTEDDLASAVDATSVTVEIRNGTSVTGAAASLGEKIAGFGYQVIGVGNADLGVSYPETLVIYTDEAYQSACENIIENIEAGRVVDGGDFYSSDANVIVIIGDDYIPIN